MKDIVTLAQLAATGQDPRHLAWPDVDQRKNGLVVTALLALYVWLITTRRTR